MSKIEDIRNALKNNDKAAQDLIKIKDVRKATQDLADDKIDVWNEESGFKKPAKKTELGCLLGVDFIDIGG